MKPYYSRPGVTLYHADCREVLPLLSGVDAVVDADARNFSVDRSKRWHSIAGDDSTSAGESIIAWGWGVASTIIAFASPEKPWPGRWRNRIVWDKGGAVGGGGDIATCLKRSWELIQVWNRRAINGPRGESVWRFPIVPADTADHIAAKPVELMIRLLETFTSDDDAVCDPFTGSGTTGVACIQTGRSFIGIELEERYCEIAAKRLEHAASGGPLFAQVTAEQELFAGVN